MNSKWDVVRIILLGLCMVSLSVVLITFNRDLMQPGRFPYAAPLVLMHMAFCSVLSFFLYLLVPSLFPSLTDPGSRVKIDRAFFMRGALPIGITFAASLVCTNLAYRHLSIAFLQMLKEANLILVYLFSLAAGLDMFSWQHVQVIAFASFAASLTVRGELHFSMLGFVIQISGQVCECMRIVMQSMLLSGQKLDPMSYVLLVSPICFVLLSLFLGLIALAPSHAVPSALSIPSSAEVWSVAPLLLANCSIAFMLNVTIAVTIKSLSPVSFIFCGIFKDLLAVIVSVVHLNDHVSQVQRVSFGLQIMAVLVWSLLRSYPKVFQTHGFIVGFRMVVTGDADALREADLIIPKAAKLTEPNVPEGTGELQRTNQSV